MKELLKYSRVNVKISDKESKKIIFTGHNLFVDSGRVFIADALRNAISGSVIQSQYYACDLGDNAATPTADDIDLINYISPLSVGLVLGYPAALSGEPSGIHFQFEFNNTGFGGDKTIRELGLFYRPDTDDYPRRGSSPTTMLGTMLARLKTTSSSIIIGDTRTVTIDWKILF